MKILKLSDIYTSSDLKKLQESEDYVLLPFFKEGKALDSSARWGMTLKRAGSMRFRWTEENPRRESLLKKIAGAKAEAETRAKSDVQVEASSGKTPPLQRKISQVQLDHTKIVLYAENEKSTFNQIADGIVTQKKELLPVVTIADCMALFFYDPITKGAGIVHSGWKGTGIAAEAIQMMKEKFGSREKDILIAMSPCIHQCCYIITEDRARYFSENFGSDCVEELEEKSPEEMKIIRSWKGLEGKLFRLSLPKANYNLLVKKGIPEENICLFDECTCCNPLFGSNRRETAEGKNFTVQAAFVRL